MPNCRRHFTHLSVFTFAEGDRNPARRAVVGMVLSLGWKGKLRYGIEQADLAGQRLITLTAETYFHASIQLLNCSWRYFAEHLGVVFFIHFPSVDGGADFTVGSEQK